MLFFQVELKVVAADAYQRRQFMTLCSKIFGSWIENIKVVQIYSNGLHPCFDQEDPINSGQVCDQASNVWKVTFKTTVQARFFKAIEILTLMNNKINFFSSGFCMTSYLFLFVIIPFSKVYLPTRKWFQIMWKVGQKGCFLTLFRNIMKVVLQL